MTGILTPPVRRAGPKDLAAVTATLTAAMLRDELVAWLVNPDEDRHRILPVYCAMLARRALEHGRVDITGDGLGVAVWCRHPQQSAEVFDYVELTRAVAPYTARFVALDDAIRRYRPRLPHDYLAHLAVHPDRQGAGCGSRLLAHHHARLDATGTAAYLEATGERNRALFARHGYGQQLFYPVSRAGHLLYPMWRPAQIHCQPSAAADAGQQKAPELEVTASIRSTPVNRNVSARTFMTAAKRWGGSSSAETYLRRHLFHHLQHRPSPGSQHR